MKIFLFDHYFSLKLNRRVLIDSIQSSRVEFDLIVSSDWLTRCNNQEIDACSEDHWPIFIKKLKSLAKKIHRKRQQLILSCFLVSVIIVMQLSISLDWLINTVNETWENERKLNFFSKSRLPDGINWKSFEKYLNFDFVHRIILTIVIEINRKK